ncbi:MAG: iron-containing alcohol dehydrogenase [Lautropia sp.]
MQSAHISLLPIEQIHYGRRAATTLLQEAERVEARRVLLMASSSLRRNTDEVTQLEAALGNRCAATVDGLGQFAPQEQVMAATHLAQDIDADLIVTFGGGSLVDAGKIVALCLHHGFKTVEQLFPYRIRLDDAGTLVLPAYEGPRVRTVAIPTTLSAGETGSRTGSLNPATRTKHSYLHPLLVPRCLIYDPAATVHTPMWMWLSTGIRALDHAIELICAPRHNPHGDASSLQAIRMLARGLPAVHRDPHDLAARLDCQYGASLSLLGRQGNVPLGISHAIGHALGAGCGVPHGYTSCVMMPHAMHFNRAMVAERHRLIADAMGHSGEDAADVIAAFVAGLGLPTSLAEVGVRSERFPAIAAHTMTDPWLHANPRKANADDVMNILAAAA